MGKIKTLLFGLLLFFIVGFWTAGQYTAPPSDATVHSICDDCYANVPLGHTFPFYGETFTNSWMMQTVLSCLETQQTLVSRTCKGDKGWCCNGLEVANIAEQTNKTSLVLQ